MLGADHLDTISSLDNLAISINNQERYQEAEALYQQALEGRKRVLGADHPDTGNAMYNLAECIEKQGQRSKEARALFMSAADIYSHV